MRPENAAGQVMNANFAVTGDGSRFEVTFESSDGKGRNSDYTAGLELVLQRLGDLRATLLEGYVNSIIANRRKVHDGLDVSLRLDDFDLPLALTRDLDVSRLRRSLGRAGALVGKPPQGSGNTTKRITLKVTLPPDIEIASEELALFLASASAQVGELEIVPPAIATSEVSDLETLRLRYAHASPKVKVQLSRTIERGTVGDKVKAANEYRCQICVALKLPPIAFHKPDGRPYAEAHHVILVSTLQLGSLGPENVICVCPNHHRELHYGNVSVADEADGFLIWLGDQKIRIRKNG